MNDSAIITWVTGLSPAAVGVGALWLNRRFGTARAGWLIFTAIGLLVTVQLLFSLDQFQRITRAAGLRETVCALTAIFVLGSMALGHALLRERERCRQVKCQADAELETRVAEKTAELTQASEELQRANAKLQAELDERKRMQGKMRKTYKEMLTVTRQAGMSEVATGVLHNIGNVLNSVNVSTNIVTEQLRQSKVEFIGRAADLIRKNSTDLGRYLTEDAQGRQLPAYLSQLAQHLADEHLMVVKEVDFIRTKIEHIKQIVATQQNYGKVTCVAEKVYITDVVDDVLRMHASELEQHEVQVRREYQPNLPEVVVDKHKVLQILLNLVSNAKHACADSGKKDRQLTVQVTNGDDRIHITMSDNGVGIPAANLNKIFTHGFSTKKSGGHGFGLHSSALAARAIGGNLTAHSNGPEQGATFRLDFPLQAAKG